MEGKASTSTATASGAAENPSGRLFYRIRDVAEILGVKPYVLRYWETEFPMISPSKSNAGQRVYKKGDIESLRLIKHLLYEERYSIEGARKRIRDLKKQQRPISIESLEENPVLKAGTALPAKSSAQVDASGARGVAQELRALSRVRISDLFHY